TIRSLRDVIPPHHRRRDRRRNSPVGALHRQTRQCARPPQRPGPALVAPLFGIRPSENEAASSGKVALLTCKTMVSSTRILRAVETNPSVPPPVQWASCWHIDNSTTYGTARNSLFEVSHWFDQ